MGNLKKTALYFECLKWQPENIALIKKHFELTITEKPLGGSSSQHVVFWPQEYSFRPSQYPDTRFVVSNTSHETEVKGDRITIISNWDAPDFMRTITATAEHTMGLIHALHRSIPRCHDFARFGYWKRRKMSIPEGMLSEMNLGILGLGRIGSMVEKMALPIFKSVKDAQSIQVPPIDILTVHLSLNDDTVNYIDAEMIGRLRPGAYLINTSRGEIVEPDALIDALEAGHLAGAALDVLPGEFTPDFYPGESRICQYARTHDNLILTPHIGGSVISAWRETEREVIEMVKNKVYG